MVHKIAFTICTLVLLITIPAGVENACNYDSRCECGKSGDEQFLQHAGERIIGARNVKPSNKYPWMVSILVGAVHCFTLQNALGQMAPNMSGKGISSSSYSDTSMFEIGLMGKVTTRIRRKVPIRNIIPHPQYDARSNANDIALVQLEKPVKCNAYTRPICLPSNVPELRRGETVYVTGWGRTEKERESPELKEAQLRANPPNCPNQLQTHICAIGDRQGTCMGDSGGPLMAIAKERFYILGITSFGLSMTCDPRLPQFYSDVKQYIQWINPIIQNSDSESF